MVNTTALEQNIQGLEPATKYTFRILAVNDAGVSPPATIGVTTEQEGIERFRPHIFLRVECVTEGVSKCYGCVMQWPR